MARSATWVSGVAIENLPEDVPAFVRSPEAATEIAVLGREFDHSKGAGETHDKERDPRHYVDLTDDVIPADPEDGSPWPLAGRTFGAMVVTNYLHRPLFPHLFAALQPGGILLYETFMVGNERFSKPGRPEFLLKDGELLELVRGRFSVIAYEARMISEPKMAMVQRIAARLIS